MKQILGTVKQEVCETAGFYDTFRMSDLMAWLPYGQVVRDAVRELCKEGLLQRVDRGVYEWR